MEGVPYDVRRIAPLTTSSNMTHHEAEVRWQRRAGEPFLDRRYSRAHAWHFDGGATIPASSSPQNVPLPWSRAEHVDPEEALVAAVASCHMLAFLFLAARRGLLVERYVDAATGEMGADEHGRSAIVRVTLRPAVTLSGTVEPDDATVAALHDAAHGECIIASSIRAAVVIDGSWTHVRDDAARAVGGAPA